MHIAGIVAEYNPFHNGHAYQLQTLKSELQPDFVIAVMSGQFSQRGLPTIADKYLRTQMALASGIDMVIELPVPFATASAERFAEASISLMHQTGIINTLCFGSELGDLTPLSAVADLLLHPTEDFSCILKKHLKQGLSFPRARAQALITCLESLYPNQPCFKDVIHSPNNILGIEYLKALKKYHTMISPYTIKRIEAGYHDLEISSHIASATAIRKLAYEDQLDPLKNCMPQPSYTRLEEAFAFLPDYEHLNRFLHYKLMMSNKSDLYSIWDIPEDLINSILNHYTNYHTLTDLVNAVTSKTYTKATVQRSLLRILLSITEASITPLEPLGWTPYIRILGCRTEALSLLGHLTKHAHCPVITNVSKSYPSLDALSKNLMDYEFKATALYHSLSGRTSYYHQDLTQAFIKL